MINFNNLNKQELARNGLVFETSEEAELFIDVITEELEVRVGEAISEGQTEETLEEFDRCSTEDAAKWLEKHCPDYPEIIEKTKSELGKQILEYRDKIPGLAKENKPSHIRDIPIN